MATQPVVIQKVYRQVHPNHMEGGIPSIEAFRPNDNDNGLLSVDNSAVWTAQQSFDHRVSILGKPSAGSFSVLATAMGCKGLDYNFLDDANKPQNNPSHVFIDMSRLSKKHKQGISWFLALNSTKEYP